MAQKLTFDEALERVNDQRPVSADEVQARALSRKVWIAEWHLPGCISESFGVCLTKRDAIEECLSRAEGAEGPPAWHGNGFAPHGAQQSNGPRCMGTGGYLHDRTPHTSRHSLRGQLCR